MKKENTSTRSIDTEEEREEGTEGEILCMCNGNEELRESFPLRFYIYIHTHTHAHI